MALTTSKKWAPFLKPISLDPPKPPEIITGVNGGLRGSACLQQFLPSSVDNLPL